jgi:hypothetical protein
MRGIEPPRLAPHVLNGVVRRRSPRSRGLRQAASRRLPRRALTRPRTGAGTYVRQTRRACSVARTRALLPQEDVAELLHHVFRTVFAPYAGVGWFDPARKRLEVPADVVIAAVAEQQTVLEQAQVAAER